MSIAKLVLQDSEDGRLIAQAIKKDNPGVIITNKPGMIELQREKEIILKASSVEHEIGREWDIEEMQLELVVIVGQVHETDDEIKIYWDN
jgi:phenol hydroxylase P2 protein